MPLSTYVRGTINMCAAGEESDGSPAASTEGPLEAKTKAGRVRKAVPADEDDDDMEVEADLGPPLRKEKNEDDDDDTKPAEAGEEAGGAEASVAAEPVADVAAVERRSKKKEDTRQAAAKDEGGRTEGWKQWDDRLRGRSRASRLIVDRRLQLKTGLCMHALML